MADITGDGINDVDLRAIGSTSTVNGAIFNQGSAPSGTGGFNDFLGLQASPTESGFNSNSGSATNTQTKTSTNFTHTILLGNIPIIYQNGIAYYEFRLDINESNSDAIQAQISLDTFDLYTSSNGNITDKNVLLAQHQAYSMDGAGNVSVLLSDAYSSGSGVSDYSILVPVSSILGPDLTNPTVDPTTTYLYLYTELGFAGANFQTNATFEEFNVQNAVSLVGLKFNDINANGVQDAGENGVQGITIYIDANKNGQLDAGERSTVTDATGHYTFYGLLTVADYVDRNFFNCRSPGQCKQEERE